MPRHLHIDHATLSHCARTGELRIDAEDEELLGGFYFEGTGDWYGREMKVAEKWCCEVFIPNPADARSCSACLDTGFICATVASADGDTLTLEKDDACPCKVRPIVERLLPPKYRWVDYHELEPCPKLKIKVETQQTLIKQIGGGALDGHSVLFSGPSRTGKTVLASALLHRMVHVYIERGFIEEYGRRQLPFHRVNADRWIADYRAYETHDWESPEPRPKPPDPDPETVGMACDDDGCYLGWWYSSKFPPLLLLEEIDKFSATSFNLNALFGLLNKVFESGGMVISTSNLSEAALKKRFRDADAEWFYRRLVESSLDEAIRHRDLYKAVTA